MEDEYDAIVLGTGLTECVISGMLSRCGKKVLHLDRNNFYGAECASLNLDQLYKQFDKGSPDAKLGKSHTYNVDLCPKLLMSGGKLVSILRNTVAARYSMEFMVVDGSYVVRNEKIHKVPATDKEAIASQLMGMFEKRRAAKCLSWVQDYDENDPKTWIKGGLMGGQDMNPNQVPMSAIFKHFGLEEKTIEFLGHAAALHTTDEYLSQPANDTIKRLQLYANSVAMYGHSPYVYPLYGLGDIPQAFARLCAVHGGTYMLNKPVKEVVLDDKGTFVGVTDEEGVTAKAPICVGDPTYFRELEGKVKPVGKSVRCICILDHPIPNIADKARSCQIIIPQAELKRKHDMYITCTSFVHKVCPEPFFLAMVSTTVETNNPEQEVEPGLKLLGPIMDKFIQVSDMYEPTDSGVESKLFISKSMDASTHFEAASADILSLFKRITGRDYDPEGADKDPAGDQ